MDELDLKILRMLRENSRQSLGVIAEKTGTSKATVSRRISRLEKEGYISSYTLTTNLSKLGLMRALIGIGVSGNLIDHAIEELRKFEEIQTIYKVFGDHSLICEVYTKSVDLLYELIQSKILKISGIQNVEVDILIERLVLNPDAELDMLASNAV
ncbi:MAG: Lrp/AsnC family transcriptional regulator [Methanomassiliicoccales archaeon]|nr:MAG: Lrp/AsnC family transcriptional regulator [Methanomassiliicoccales archaeon]